MTDVVTKAALTPARKRLIELMQEINYGRIESIEVRNGEPVSDREDLEQELILDLLHRLPKFDPDRARRNTFIASVVEHKVATIIEARKAGMRDYRRCRCSLNDRFENEEGNFIERMEGVDQED
jgi:RNA polymerase sigma-70 factor (ECF subfamily)